MIELAIQIALSVGALLALYGIYLVIEASDRGVTRCPWIGCNSKYLERYGDHWRCRQCGYVFDLEECDE